MLIYIRGIWWKNEQNRIKMSGFMEFQTLVFHRWKNRIFSCIFTGVDVSWRQSSKNYSQSWKTTFPGSWDVYHSNDIQYIAVTKISDGSAWIYNWSQTICPNEGEKNSNVLRNIGPSSFYLIGLVARGGLASKFLPGRGWSKGHQWSKKRQKKSAAKRPIRSSGSGCAVRHPQGGRGNFYNFMLSKSQKHEFWTLQK